MVLKSKIQAQMPFICLNDVKIQQSWGVTKNHLFALGVM